MMDQAGRGSVVHSPCAVLPLLACCDSHPAHDFIMQNTSTNIPLEPTSMSWDAIAPYTSDDIHPLLSSSSIFRKKNPRT
jgi:hypothetical protein